MGIDLQQDGRGSRHLFQRGGPDDVDRATARGPPPAGPSSNVVRGRLESALAWSRQGRVGFIPMIR
jgi:hypothetical protein